VYRASIENEVGWPEFATEKGGSRAKHEVGCELISVADVIHKVDILEQLPNCKIISIEIYPIF